LDDPLSWTTGASVSRRQRRADGWYQRLLLPDNRRARQSDARVGQASDWPGDPQGSFLETIIGRADFVAAAELRCLVVVQAYFVDRVLTAPHELMPTRNGRM
jgi:hypothetical protein